MAEHPELVDINFVESPHGPRARRPAKDPPPRRPDADQGRDAGEGREASKAEVEKLKSIGYVGSAAQPGAAGQPGLDPRQRGRLQRRARPDRDQRARVQRDLDHRPQHDHGRGRRPHRRAQRARAATCSTAGAIPASTAPAPRPTRRSSPSTTPTGSPAASRARGTCSSSTTAGSRPDGNYSSVDELSSRSTRKGSTRSSRERPSGPRRPVWSYSAPKKSDFFSFFISGAHRLPNGNTLICSGRQRHDLRGDADKEIVWKYVNPVKGGFGPGGSGGPAAAANQVLPRSCRTRWA